MEIARHFAREGARLSIIDINAEDLPLAEQQLKKETGAAVDTYQGDIARRNEMIGIIDQVEQVQPIDILINNAGIAFETPFLDIRDEEWKRIIDINLTGFFIVSQLVCRYMAKRKRGAVVNMASKNALDGEFGYAHYNASKGGIVMLTKTMAIELAHLGIRVNAVCPGYIRTPMSEAIDPPEFAERFASRYIPMDRPGSAEEIAPVFLFLAGNDSSFITGQIIIADGGQLAGQKPGADLLGRMDR